MTNQTCFVQGGPDWLYGELCMGAKDKIIEYLKEHLNEWVHNQDLRRISGANDTPRILRALRQEGWQIEVMNRMVV